MNFLTRKASGVPRNGGNMTATATTPVVPDAKPAPVPPPTDTAKPPPTEQGNPDESNLGDAGKQALDRMKAERNEAKRQATELQVQLDAINRANESALEKAQREATEANEKATQATADALRFRIAAKHSISDDDADLFLTGSDPETLERQALRLIERGPASPRPDPSQGAKGTPSASADPAAVFAQFIQKQQGT